jgi:hypothetical protein
MFKYYQEKGSCFMLYLLSDKFFLLLLVKYLDVLLVACSDSLHLG